MTVVVASDVAARVALGVAWIDENVPGWGDRVDLDCLDIGNRRNCVIGQLFGDYFYGPLPRREAMALGFQRTADDGYGVLESLWRQVVAARRAGGAS